MKACNSQEDSTISIYYSLYFIQSHAHTLLIGLLTKKNNLLTFLYIFLYKFNTFYIVPDSKF